MKTSNGNVLQKTISKVFPINADAALVELLFLLIVGVTAVLLRAYLRVPMQIPGHHGLEVMAILIIGRAISKISIASSISTIFSALSIFIFGFGLKDPFLPFIYIAMGMSIDILYAFLKQKKYVLLIFALIGGISYMIIPISRILITLSTGFQYQSFIKHAFYAPLFTHFAFGAAGAVLGAGLIYSLKRLKKQ